MVVLNWKHHTLIQALLTRGPLPLSEFHSIFVGITDKNLATNRSVFNDYLLKINKELSFVHFDLRACRDQYDGQIYYGLVNNVSDEQSKLGTKYSVPQIAFFKGIVEAILQDVTAQGSISNIDALNIRLENQVLSGAESQSQGGSLHLPSAFRSFSISQKEKTLEQLVHDRWLCNTEDGKIGVGIRSILDLRSWFHNAGVPSCEVCNESGLKAQLCPNEDCTIRIHLYCLKKKFSKTSQNICPSCGTQWPYNVSEAEAIEPHNEPSLAAHGQPSQGSKRKRLRSNQNDGADNDACSSQTALSGDTYSRRLTRSSSAREQENNPSLVSQSQPSQGSKRMRHTSNQNDGADNVGCSSQAPSSGSDTRRVTRSSSRLR